MLLAEIARHPEAVEDALLGERLRWRDVAGGENAGILPGIPGKKKIWRIHEF
jgi:hypothetical protein